MGMAASQARFLQLTARRTNIEYQGQQINQSRLALANASAGLFEKMLSLEVPTPPSSQDSKYYTQGYKFTDRRDEIQKKISWVTTQSAANSGSIIFDDITIISEGSTSVTIAADTLNGVAGATVSAGTLMSVANALGMDTSNVGEDKNQLAIKYVTTEHTIYDPDGNLSVIERKAPALLEFDNLNRLLNITFLDQTDPATGKTEYDMSDTSYDALRPFSVGNGELLTYSGEFDQKAYDDDMNKYEFQKAAYDYQIEQINIETEKIQIQDRSLELKMKQLDTEHNAVQTEMDAVQKVLQKNIESTFKTFG